VCVSATMIAAKPYGSESGQATWLLRSDSSNLTRAVELKIGQLGMIAMVITS
jgi:hypothetical protein